MRADVQRVSSATVRVGDRTVGAIEQGLVVLIGVEQNDGPSDVQYITSKVRDMRVFDDAGTPARHLDRSVLDVKGAVLVVSQFTLAADCRRGRRPSFDGAAPPVIAKALYEDVVRELQSAGLRVATGEFQAMMQISLVNDGPVTLLLDSRKTF